MKPIVYFRKDQEARLINDHAYVFPINHPNGDYVSNTKHVRTSKVVRYTLGEDDQLLDFETENSIYLAIAVKP